MFNKLKPIEYNHLEYLDSLITSISSSKLPEEIQERYINGLKDLKHTSDSYQKEYRNLIQSFNTKQEIPQESIIKLNTEESGRDIWKRMTVMLKKTKYYNQIKRICCIDGRYFCPVCGLEMMENLGNNNYSKVTIDHIVPKDKHKEYIIYPHNLVPMCERCNNKKGNKIPEYIFHPFYINDSIDSSKSVKVNQFNRKNQYLLEYRWNDFENQHLKESYESIFDLNSLYQEQIYKKEIWNYFYPIVNNLYNVSDKHSEEVIKRVLLSEVRFRIKQYQVKSELSDYEKLVFLSLEAIDRDFEIFFNTLKPSI